MSSKATGGGQGEVAVLCAAKNSVYHSLPGVVVYDETRDARTFPGNMRVIVHAPCRTWSAFTAHQAKPAPGERDLGLWCAGQLKKCGGVLEHPAHSRLFDAAGLPKPGNRSGRLWTIGDLAGMVGIPDAQSDVALFLRCRARVGAVAISASPAGAGPTNRTANEPPSALSYQSRICHMAAGGSQGMTPHPKPRKPNRFWEHSPVKKVVWPGALAKWRAKHPSEAARIEKRFKESNKIKFEQAGYCLRANQRPRNVRLPAALSLSGSK